jgi:hypothetical protein
LALFGPAASPGESAFTIPREADKIVAEIALPNGARHQWGL